MKTIVLNFGNLLYRYLNQEIKESSITLPIISQEFFFFQLLYTKYKLFVMYILSFFINLIQINCYWLAIFMKSLHFFLEKQQSLRNWLIGFSINYLSKKIPMNRQ